MLTSGQIAHFETFGFLVLRQVFTTEETDVLREASLGTFLALRGGGGHIAASLSGDYRSSNETLC